MDVAGGNIVLIVNGVLVRDDAGIIENIQQKVHHLMDAGADLSQAIADFQGSITTLIDDVEALLTQPQPNIQAAVAALQGMKTQVDTEAAKVQGVLNPPATP